MSLPPLVEPADELTIDEVRRYSRHLIIPDVGMSGQKRLKNAKVLVIGAGGLGSPALLYLAAAGVGTLGIAEFDEVDESNLQRQVIHGQSDVGKSKARSAMSSIAAAWYPWATKTSSADSSSCARRALRGMRPPRGFWSWVVVTCGSLLGAFHMTGRRRWSRGGKGTSQAYDALCLPHPTTDRGVFT